MKRVGKPHIPSPPENSVRAAAARVCCQWFESLSGTGSRGWIVMGKEDTHFAQNYEEGASNSHQGSPWKEGLELWLGRALV